MRRIPATTALLAFEAAARLGSFVRAAEELSVTPGAVSRQIQGLEEQLGAALFQRHHRRVQLTPLGRRYLGQIALPLERLAEATAQARGETRGDAISICTYPSFAIRWFMPRWARFHDTHPNLDLRLTTSLDPADLDSGQYHLAIQVLEAGTRRPGLGIDKLLDVITYPVASPELARRLRTPGDLAGATLLHGDPRPGDWPSWLAEAGVTGIDGSKGLRFESTNLAIQGAIAGLGVAIGVHCLIEADLEAGSLVPLFDVRRLSSRPIHLVYPESRLDDPGFTALRDWLLDEAR